MALLWYCISEGSRIELAKLYRGMAGFPFTPPADDYNPKTLKVNITLEEVEREMSKRPHKTKGVELGH